MEFISNVVKYDIAIMNTEINLRALAQVTEGHRDTLLFLAEHGLIRNNYDSTVCQVPCSLPLVYIVKK